MVLVGAVRRVGRVVLSLPAVLSASCLYGYLSEKNKAIPYMPNMGFCLVIVVFLMFENGAVDIKNSGLQICKTTTKPNEFLI